MIDYFFQDVVQPTLTEKHDVLPLVDIDTHHLKSS